ncbi:hypothetical protein CQW23_03126 [Capsicum baccatum]|uniref:ABC transporter domain-containing protein n=1 Tax=Capsicum baccatum TaxID=33114 RepID=A0A2G2XAY8_CAPBA|nr:hypothetical protein CQW23_03126 [Capsicum baccatum]
MVSIGPLFLYAFIEVAKGKGAFKYKGYVLAGATLIAKYIESLVETQWFFRTRLIGLQVKSLLTAAIYDKQLCLSNVAKNTHSPGLATIPALSSVVASALRNSPIAKYQHKCLTELMVAQDRMLKRSIPNIFGVFIEAKVFLSQIVEFLEALELQNRRIEQKYWGKELEPSIFIKYNGISWVASSPNPAVKSVKLHVKKGQNLAICGEVGSGKSTILAAILGEVP